MLKLRHIIHININLFWFDGSNISKKVWTQETKGWSLSVSNLFCPHEQTQDGDHPACYQHSLQTMVCEYIIAYGISSLYISHQTWKVYTGFRAAHAPIRMTCLSENTLNVADSMFWTGLSAVQILEHNETNETNEKLNKKYNKDNWGLESSYCEIMKGCYAPVKF